MFAVATGSSTQEWAWSLVPELFRSVVPVAEGLGRECGSVFEAGSPSSARQRFSLVFDTRREGQGGPLSSNTVTGGTSPTGAEHSAETEGSRDMSATQTRLLAYMVERTALQP